MKTSFSEAWIITYSEDTIVSSFCGATADNGCKTLKNHLFTLIKNMGR